MTYPYYTSKYTYEPQTLYYSKNRHDIEQKPLNTVDFKQSNISQQTIINKAKLHSPDRNPAYGVRNYQVNDKTRTKKLKDDKIYDMGDFYQRELYTEVQEFGGVGSTGDKHIFGMFQEGDDQGNYTPNIGRSGVQKDANRSTTFGPSNYPQYQYPKLDTKDLNQREDRKFITRDNIYKKSAIEYLKTDRNFQEGNPSYQGTYQTIEEIQRKAVQEIESLRKDKIQLMRKLNQQIKAHNEQKKLRIQLENQLARLKGQQQYPKPQIKPPSQLKYPLPEHQPVVASQPPSQSQIYTISHQPPPNTKINTQFIPQSKHQPGTISSQHQILYEKQINRLQQQNANLKKNIRLTTTQPSFRESQKEDLKQQITSLNEKIINYQLELDRLKGTKNTNVYQGHTLLQQGQAIKSETLRLMKQHDTYNSQVGKQYYSRELPQKIKDSNNLMEKNKGFKKKLAELQSERQIRINQGSKKYFQPELSGLSNLPINNRISKGTINAQNNTDNYMRDFEQII